MTQFITNKKYLVIQPYFLGDILFVMAAVQKYVNDGYDVIYPVRDEYLNLKKNFPTVNMVSINQIPNLIEKYSDVNSIEDDEYITLPFHKSILRETEDFHMKNKYEYLNLPMEMWRKIQISRDIEKETQLFSELGLKHGDKYNLINEFHRPFFHRTPIVVEGEYKNIYMSQLDGYSLLDWIGIMEKAQSIHTVATSIIFLMDSIDSMPNEMHLYRRYRGEEHNGGYWDHSAYNYLIIKNYIYH